MLQGYNKKLCHCANGRQILLSYRKNTEREPMMQVNHKLHSFLQQRQKQHSSPLTLRLFMNLWNHLHKGFQWQKHKCIELEHTTRLQETYTTRTPHLDQLSPSTVTKILSTGARIAPSLSPAPLPLPAVHQSKNHRRAHTCHQVQGTHPFAFSSSYSCFACKFYMKTKQNGQWNYTAMTTAVQYTSARVRKWHFYWPVRIWYATIISKDDD